MPWPNVAIARQHNAILRGTSAVLLPVQARGPGKHMTRQLARHMVTGKVTLRDEQAVGILGELHHSRTRHRLHGRRER